MKPLTLVLLTGSVVLNGALAYAAFTGSSRIADEAAAQAAAAAAEAADKAARPAGPAPVDPATWSKLKTDDLPALVARLREAGFPIDMIRAITRGLVSELFQARIRALDPNAADRAFWKNNNPDPKVGLAQNQLYYEQQKMVRELLGSDARDTDPMTQARYRAMFGNLPPEKLDAAIAITEEANRKRAELYFTKGSTSMADQQVFEREQHNALASLLSPAELEEFDFRNSNTGRTLRNDLASFNPSEQEFRDIYKLRQPYDEKYNYYTGIQSQAQMRERSTAQEQLNKDIVAVLGPDRAAAYTLSTDYNYQQTTQLVARLELPPETATTLVNTQKDFEKRRNEIYTASSTATPEERTAQLTALQQEAIAKLTPILGGASRIDAYKQYGGQWIQSLVPRPRPTTPTPTK